MSGFWSSSGTFCAPMMVAPSVPRSAWGVMSDVSFQRTPFGASLAYGTVGVAEAAEADSEPTTVLLETAVELSSAAAVELLLDASEAELNAGAGAAVA